MYLDITHLLYLFLRKNIFLEKKDAVSLFFVLTDYSGRTIL